MRIPLRLLSLVLLASASISPLAAHAGNLSGDIFNVNFESIPTLGSSPFIYGAGLVTAPASAQTVLGTVGSSGPLVPILSWQITGTQVIFDFFASTFFDFGYFNGPIFQDFTHSFSSVALDPSSSAVGFLSSQASIQGSTLSFNFQGLSFAANTSAVYDVSNNATTAVTPEPSSLLLLGTGALGTVGILRRRILA